MKDTEPQSKSNISQFSGEQLEGFRSAFRSHKAAEFLHGIVYEVVKNGATLDQSLELSTRKVAPHAPGLIIRSKHTNTL